MLQVADDLFNTLDPDIYNKILALDGVKDNFFMAYELHFGFGSLETYLVGYSDFKLCTRNALTDAGLIGIYNMHDQIGLWDAMNAFYPWHVLADKMIQHNPDAFLLAGLGYLPQYATQMLESGMPIAIGPGVWQPLYKISLEQFFDSIRTYPGLGEAYMLQLTNQLIALGYASPGWSYAVGEHHIYGSSRLGIHQTKKELRNRYKQEEIFIPSNTVNTAALYRGKRNYELSNHLGNVQMVISDKRKSVCDEELGVEYFVAEVLSAVDYYPFGMMMPDRQWYAGGDSSIAVNGLNGMRNDHEITGHGNSYTTEFRQLDVRIVRWFSLDPKYYIFPEMSAYIFIGNSPLIFIDPDGDEFFVADNKQSKDDVKSLVKEENQDYIKFGTNGQVTLDFGDMKDLDKDKLLKSDEGLKLIYDIQNSPKKILYEASDIALHKDINGMNSFTILFYDPNNDGVNNASNGGLDGANTYSTRPKDGFDGQVTIHPEAQWKEVDSKGNLVVKQRASIVFHELSENYERTHNNINYHGSPGAHEIANSREKRWHKKSHEPGVVTGEVIMPSISPRRRKELIVLINNHIQQ